MDYQEYILDLLRKQVKRKKRLVVTEVMRFPNQGRWLVMRGTECLLTLDFDFQSQGPHFSINSQQLLVMPRSNRVFWWRYAEVDDMNEEVQRFAKVWGLILKEVAGDDVAKAVEAEAA